MPDLNIDTLRALQERVRAASGPDIELDAAIDVAIFGGETVWKTANYTMEQYPASRRPSENHIGGFANEYVPRVTSSIDACVALVEKVLPGWHWDVARDNTAMVRDPEQSAFASADYVCWGNKVKSPPLALLYATLQALLQIEERKAGGEGR